MTDPGSFSSRHPGRRPGVYFDRLKVTGDIPSPSGNSSVVSFRWTWIPDQVRNDGIIPDESAVLQQAVVIPHLIQVPSAARHPGPGSSPGWRTRGPFPPFLCRHPGRRPGVYFDRLKVTGDIPSPSGNSSVVSSRWTWIPDQVRNDGIIPDESGVLQPKGFNETFDNIRRRKPQKKSTRIAIAFLFWSFEFWTFEFVSNFVLRISNLKFLYLFRISGILHFPVYTSWQSEILSFFQSPVTCWLWRKILQIRKNGVFSKSQKSVNYF
jgi:hypothetical protein